MRYEPHCQKHSPQSSVPPHPSSMTPHWCPHDTVHPASGEVVHRSSFPHVEPVGHWRQCRSPPQPSPAGAQGKPSCAQVCGQHCPGAHPFVQLHVPLA